MLERPRGEPVVVRQGQRVPDARLGNYRRLYVVDMAPRGLSFTENAPSADPAFPFAVKVGFACQVTDPVAIVRDGVTDMTACLSPSMASIVRQVAVGFDVLDPASAEAAITHRLVTADSVPSLRLNNFTVRVAPIDSAEIISARRELRVQEMKRDAMRPVAGGDRTEILAQIMALMDGDPTPLLDREQEAKERHTQAILDMVGQVNGSTGPKRDYVASRIKEEAMNTFFPGSLTSGKRGGIRDRIERKSRAVVAGDSAEQKPNGDNDPPKSTED
ncbi:hypothetical protein EV192_115139 [Actinocrispum wychmicini]|uniref:Uncharacterized protein n=1 Tax=Actinocrispum wychmicini TaxID=1213861 RepID=A0A4R2IXA3_9PSEU|nr:hypothetical protein EV192_115139 [Actinocrispum wychmicini]